MSRNAKITESTVTLPPSDPRKAMMEHLSAMCAKCVQLAHKCSDLHYVLDGAIRDAQEDPASKMDACLEAQRQYLAAFYELNHLADQVDHDSRDWNMNHPERESIFVAHTDAGLPVRVSPVRRNLIWG